MKNRSSLKFLIALGMVSVLLWSSFLMIDVSYAQVSVVDSKTNPESFMAGDTGTVTVTIKNSGSRGILSSGAVNIKEIYLESNEIVCHQGYSNIGEILPGGVLSSAESTTLVFPITVPQDMKDGVYFLNLKVVTDTGVKTYSVPIEVDNRSVDLIEQNIPSSIPLKGSTDVELRVVNNRSNPVYNVRIKPVGDFNFTPSEAIILSSTPTEAKKAETTSAPTQAIPGLEDTLKQYQEYLGGMLGGQQESAPISKLAPFESKVVTFSVTPKDIGDNKEMRFVLQYTNGKNVHTNELVKSIDVMDMEEIKIVFNEYPSSINRGKDGKISMDIVNGSSEKIESVRVVALDDNIVPSEVFIGEMPANSTFPASFTITTDKVQDTGEKDATFKVVYKSGGTYYESDEYSVGYNISASSTTPETGFTYTMLPLILVVFIVLGIFVIRKRR
ncbi:MAG TPA: hypothetical protein HA221_03050 [Halobacteria archaeon]|nr:hypothetical protein [Halobacteria archaeon]